MPQSEPESTISAEQPLPPPPSEIARSDSKGVSNGADSGPKSLDECFYAKNKEYAKEVHPNAHSNGLLNTWSRSSMPPPTPSLPPPLLDDDEPQQNNLEEEWVQLLLYATTNIRIKN